MGRRRQARTPHGKGRARRPGPFQEIVVRPTKARLHFCSAREEDVLFKRAGAKNIGLEAAVLARGVQIKEVGGLPGPPTSFIVHPPPCGRSGF